MPVTTERAAGVASAVVGGFRDAPVLLLIVILNLAAMGAASYFLVRQDTSRQEANKELFGLLRSCITRGYTQPGAE
jgi:hypothetical protein